jgi:hypothetical protein
MAKAKSLLDEVKDSLPGGRGPRTWYHTLPDDVREECDRIKAAYKAGAMGTKTGLSTALSKALKARGIDIGHSGVGTWLERP